MDHQVPRLKFAEQLAYSWHKGQVDQSGVPYIEHVKAVVDGVKDLGRSYQIVAWLHDTIEDTTIPADALTYLLYDERDAIYLLTRRLHEEYGVYIDRIEKSGSALAIAVKISDLKHNISRLDNLPKDRAESLYKRYSASLLKLGAELD